MSSGSGSPDSRTRAAAGTPARARWADIKTRIRIPQILAALGLLSRFRRRGARWVGPCPIHGGDNPNAFTVDGDRNVWFCFTRCGRGGTVLDLALALSGGSWSHMEHWLFGLTVVPATTGELTSTPPGDGDRAHTFRPFRAALDLDPHHPFFQRMGLRPDTVGRFQAGAWHGRGFLAGTVAVRLHDRDGEAIGYAGRRLDPDLIRRWGKWKWPRGFPKSQLLYAWHLANADLDRRLIVVEGAWSVMKLHQAGVSGAVAVGGTSVSATQRALLSRARKLVLFLDGDAAGRSATVRLVRGALHPNLRVVPCPDALDPADLDEDTLRRLLGADV